MTTKGKRKVRSDKKRDIKPTISIELKDSIYRLGYITQTPVKDISEQLCIYAINSNSILNKLSQHFQRDIVINKTLYKGNLLNAPILKRAVPGTNDRITTRLSNSVYDVISALSYALDCTISRTCAVVIEEGMKDVSFIDSYVKTYLEGQLDAKRMNELKKVIAHVNGSDDEEHSLAALWSYITDEVKKPLHSAKETVSEFVIHHWKDQ